jgi:microcompartment protein CcmK/EutM
MILARVVGNVVSSAKHPSFEGHRILIVQPVNEVGEDLGDSLLASDSVQAGPGDTVLVEQEGNCARQILGRPEDPFHSVVVGIVDQVLTREG